jgi:hypothetical protein
MAVGIRVYEDSIIRQLVNGAANADLRPFAGAPLFLVLPC